MRNLISGKVMKPISIKVSTDNVILSSGKKEIELEDKILIEGEHYGFIMINSIDEIEYEETYSTQRRIKYIALNNGTVSIYESGKPMPWKFNNDGRLLENPFLSSISRTDIKIDINAKKEKTNVYVKK